jgi:P27 family predicted phage terminase small subunit
MSRSLFDLGLLTRIDRTALAAYCQLWARWVKAEGEVERLGEVVKAPQTGYPMQNPYLGIANTALKLMHNYLVEFGMTPSSRSRVKAKTPKGQADDRRRKFGLVVGGSA